MKQLQPEDFDIFSYKIPAKKTPSEFAAEAITLLKNFDIHILPYLLSSDIVLTLSGVRAFDTYISFEGLDNSEISKLRGIFTKLGFTLESESSEYEEPVDFYYLVNHAALLDIPDQYRFGGWINPNPPFINDRMHAWTYFIERNLFSMMEKNTLPKEWLPYHLSAHNIRFGILLGYPGEAIACGCWMDILGEKQMPNALSSTLAYHDAYDAAWPTYYYTDAVENDTNILAHQKLWSDILSGVYESDWHSALQANNEFKNAAAKIHALKNP